MFIIVHLFLTVSALLVLLRCTEKYLTIFYATFILETLKNVNELFVSEKFNDTRVCTIICMYRLKLLTSVQTIYRLAACTNISAKRIINIL